MIYNANILYGFFFNQVAIAKDGLALALYNLKQYAEAIKCCQESLKLKQDIFGSSSSTQPSVAETYNNMAVILQRMGDNDQAMEAFQHTVKIKSESLGQMHLSVAGTLKNQGKAQAAAGKLNDALHSFERAVAIEIDAFQNCHPCIVSTWTTISAMRSKLGWADKAAEAQKESERVKEAVKRKEDELRLEEEFRQEAERQLAGFQL
jgi:tetratricopeptide (TPR) repeat protein